MTEKGWGTSQAATCEGEPHARKLHLEVPSEKGMRKISEKPMKVPSLERFRSYTFVMEKAKI